MPKLQFFFQLAIGKPGDGLASTPSRLAGQVWDVLLAYDEKCNYDCSTAGAAWFNTVHHASCL